MYIALAALAGIAIGIAAMWGLWRKARQRTEHWKAKHDAMEAKSEIDVAFWKRQFKNSQRLGFDTMDDLAAVRLENTILKAKAEKTQVHHCPDDADALRDEARREGWPEAQKTEHNEEG